MDDSFQSLIEEYEEELFVGRTEQLDLFRKAVAASRPPFLILGVSGQGGVGKSSLLRQYRQMAEDSDALCGLVNEYQTSVADVLSVFSRQFGENGYPFEAFDERYHKYKELKEMVESDPEVPKGLLEFLARGATRVGVRTLKKVPVAGDVLDVLLSNDAESALADHAADLAKYVAKKLGNKDERVLVFDAERELTARFVADLNILSSSQRVFLMFDTYEKTSLTLDSWLIDLLIGKFGHFSGRVGFVIAGRFPLGQQWTRFRGALRQIVLEEFTPAEAREYVVRLGFTDEQQIQQLLRVSKGLPVLLALLASVPGKATAEVAGDAVERFLGGVTFDQQEAALLASVPRFFNQDILEITLPQPSHIDQFRWLIGTPFVSLHSVGWVYHDLVRGMLLH